MKHYCHHETRIDGPCAPQKAFSHAVKYAGHGKTSLENKDATETNLAPKKPF
jgi:hypothetical protein